MYEKIQMIEELFDEELSDFEKKQISSLIFNLINSDPYVRIYFFSEVSKQLDFLEKHVVKKKEILLAEISGKEIKEFIN